MGGEGKTVLQAKAMNACDFPRKQPWPAPNCPLEWTKLLLCHLRYMWELMRRWLLLFPIRLQDSVKCVSIREINDLQVVIAPKRLFFPSFQNPFFKKKMTQILMHLKLPRQRNAAAWLYLHYMGAKFRSFTHTLVYRHLLLPKGPLNCILFEANDKHLAQQLFCLLIKLFPVGFSWWLRW